MRLSDDEIDRRARDIAGTGTPDEKRQKFAELSRDMVKYSTQSQVVSHIGLVYATSEGTDKVKNRIESIGQLLGELQGVPFVATQENVMSVVAMENMIREYLPELESLEAMLQSFVTDAKEMDTVDKHPLE